AEDMIQLALEDVGGPVLRLGGPSFPMADLMGPLLDQDEDEALSPFSSLEGRSSAYSSILGTKAGTDSLLHPWLATSDLLDAHVGADDGKAGEAFMDMDWMSEKIDLNELDLDSLISSCSSDESPTSPEDLLASLDSSMEVDLAIPSLPEVLDVLPTIALPQEVAASEAKQAEEPRHEESVKSEPPSPAPSPCPPSPVCTLEVESEEDALEPDPIVLSLPTPGHIVVVLTNKSEPPLVSLPDQSIKSPPLSDCESDSGIESISSSPTRSPSPPSTPAPTAGSSRTKPYSKLEPTVSPPAAKAARLKSVSGAPKVVEKKLKKMEQNKTAATRYRQKKRVEQELLTTELQDLEQRNRELGEKAESISREIQYLKDLMEEVRKHRRGRTSSAAQ
uniref:Cyclic AMP-dependent transcription factor ATF-4 n=1 Tax=Tetraodon nigroviridis TaxID=99883 RepID=H3C6Q1_TETNG